eukprot:3940856-Rhodomonas_salina.2
MVLPYLRTNVLAGVAFRAMEDIFGLAARYRSGYYYCTRAPLTIVPAAPVLPVVVVRGFTTAATSVPAHIRVVLTLCVCCYRLRDTVSYAFRSQYHSLTPGTAVSVLITRAVLEIYNERVFDLLVDPRTAAERRKGTMDLGIHVDGVKGVRVQSSARCSRVWEFCTGLGIRVDGVKGVRVQDHIVAGYGRGVFVGAYGPRDPRGWGSRGSVCRSIQWWRVAAYVAAYSNSTARALWAHSVQQYCGAKACRSSIQNHVTAPDTVRDILVPAPDCPTHPLRHLRYCRRPQCRRP